LSAAATSSNQSVLELIDSHCHFDFQVFDPDREAVWRDCRAQGLTDLILPGTDPTQWQRARDLSHSREGLWFSVGLHPWWLDSAKGHDWEGSLVELLQDPKCVALGECGLDKLIDTPMAEQEQYLVRQLDLARDWNKPVILHCVKAHNSLIRLLKQHTLPKGGVVHAFTGSTEIAKTYWKMGFRLGVGGSITYPRAKKTRAAVAALPEQALLLETDAPDMPLVGRQGQRNSPQYLEMIVRELAALRLVSPEQIARQTAANARDLFGITPP